MLLFWYFPCQELVSFGQFLCFNNFFESLLLLFSLSFVLFFKLTHFQTMIIKLDANKFISYCLLLLLFCSKGFLCRWNSSWVSNHSLALIFWKAWYYRGTWHALQTISKEVGILGLYKGLGTTLFVCCYYQFNITWKCIFISYVISCISGANADCWVKYSNRVLFIWKLEIFLAVK